ncbi:MAG: PLP-dependent transferase [Chitinophagaceae bacterium]|nr:PLP-dependent transferase [Chitinophagaceae bacterium]
MQEQTKIIHSIPADPLTGAISVPIYQTATFVQESPGVHQGFDYARSNNPTRQVLENMLRDLEEGSGASAFSSGLAAIDAVLKLLKSGDEILAVEDIYGGAFRLFTHVYEQFGIRVNYADVGNLEQFEQAITPGTKLIWLESPTNPTLKIADIPAIAKLARQHGCLLCVDNTFASPISQKPIQLGADLVVHSGTKYLAGHSDLIAGIVVASSPELAAKIKFIQNASGAILGPFDAWLLIRGLQTLPLRIRQHSQNAQILAEWLEANEQVAQVNYPGLKTHPSFESAKRQQKWTGGVLSFYLKGDEQEDALYLIQQLKLFKLAESLGGVKSLICLPAAMTHKSIPTEKRFKAGITESLIRLSAGIEDAADLLDDLKQAFDQLNHRRLHAIKPTNISNLQKELI